MTAGAWTTYESPIGTLELCWGERGLRALRFPGHPQPLDPARHDPAPFAAALRAAKAELDPAAILNPGVLLDP